MVRHYRATGRPRGRPRIVYVRKDIGFPQDVFERIEDERARTGRDFSAEVIAQLRLTARVDTPPDPEAR